MPMFFSNEAYARITAISQLIAKTAMRALLEGVDAPDPYQQGRNAFQNIQTMTENLWSIAKNCGIDEQRVDNVAVHRRIEMIGQAANVYPHAHLNDAIAMRLVQLATTSLELAECASRRVVGEIENRLGAVNGSFDVLEQCYIHLMPPAPAAGNERVAAAMGVV